MADLREGTKVKTVTGLIGIVEARYDLGTAVYYLVKMEDGALYKYFADQLTEIEEEPEKTPEEPTESDSITITRKEFRDKSTDVAVEMMKKEMESGSMQKAFAITTLGAVISAHIEYALFGELREEA